MSGTNGILVTPANPSTPAFSTTTGYDLATGLGSVNVDSLVKNWSTVTSLPSITTLSATVNGQPVTGITHGTPVNLSSTVAPGQGANGTPSGQVALLATPNPTAGTPGPSLGFDVLHLSSGTATGNVVLPGGTYSLTAHYQGDGTFGSSDSTPGIPVNISAEPSKTLVSLPTFDPNTGSESGNAPTTLVYGSPYIARIDAGNANAALSFSAQPVCTPPTCPSGTITLTDALNGGAATLLDGGNFTLNSSGFTEDLAIQLLGGTHQLSASYSGDNSFKSSSGTYALTVTPAATRILPPNPPLPPMVSTPFSLSVIVTPNAFGVMPSCNLTFVDGTTVVPGTLACAWQANGPFLYVSLPVSQTTAGTHTYMAKFNGDTNYAPFTSAPMTTKVFYGTTTTLSADSMNVQYGSSITLTAVVDSSVSQGPSISQAVNFLFDNGPMTGAVTYSPFTDASGNIALRASLTTVPQSSGFYTANFAGDSTYFQSAALLNVNVNIPDFSLSANFPAPSITAGGSAAATITVTPVSNASSPVMLTCPPVSLYGTPAGISCSFSSSTVNLSNSTAATSTLTISSLAPSSNNTTSFSPPQPPSVYLLPGRWPLPLIPILALLLFLLFPVSARRKSAVTAAALACGLCFFLGFFGCGGGAASVGGGGGGGPVPTSITLTASGVKVPFSQTSGGAVNLTANVTATKTPGGTATFVVDGDSGFTAPVPLVGGVAQFQLTGLSVGVHAISAQYSRDANTLSSQTKGSLNVAVTGQTGVSVQGTTGGLTHTVAVNFDLQ